MSIQICKILANTFELDFLKKTWRVAMVAHTWDPSIQEVEAGELYFKTSLG